MSNITHPRAFMIVEIDVLDECFSGTLKQQLDPNPKQLAMFNSGA